MSGYISERLERVNFERDRPVCIWKIGKGQFWKRSACLYHLTYQCWASNFSKLSFNLFEWTLWFVQLEKSSILLSFVGVAVPCCPCCPCCPLLPLLLLPFLLLLIVFPCIAGVIMPVCLCARERCGMYTPGSVRYSSHHSIPGDSDATDKASGRKLLI